MSEPEKSVCIIHDSDVFRSGLISLFDKSDKISSLVDINRNEYPAYNCLQKYDLIITDIEFNSLPDVEFIKELRTNNPSSKIIVYTQFKNSRYRMYSLYCGADFFIFIEDEFFLIKNLVEGIIAEA